MSTSLIEQVTNEYYTYAEAANVLGVGKMTLWRWLRNGKLQAYRIGREVLIEKAEVEKLRRSR